MKLKVLKQYQGWASGDILWEPDPDKKDVIVEVSDAVIDLPSPEWPDNIWRGTRGEYLLKTFPDRFAEVKSRRGRKADAEE